MYSEEFVDVTFGDHPAEKLFAALKPGDELSAAQLLAALDGESESVLDEQLDLLHDMAVTIKLEDLPRYSADTELSVRLRQEEQLAKQDDLMRSLDSGDPLRLYLEELAGIPACGDLDLMAKQLCDANRSGLDDGIHANVLNLCLHRVVSLACTFVGKGVLLMDLIQEGSLGLWEGLQQYDGGDFGAFRDHWICWYMTKAVVSQAYASGVEQKLRHSMEDYRAVDEKLLTELGRNPTLEEIAEAMHHITPDEAKSVLDMVTSARNMNRVKRSETQEIPQEEDQAVEDTAYFQMRQRIAELLSGLSEQDAKLLTLRYGLEGGLPMDSQQVGQKLGITAQEVNEREAAALAKLRQ